MRIAATILLLFATACSDDENELTVHQGPCEGLDETACKADDQCQLAYGVNALAESPDDIHRFWKCLRVESGASTTVACDALASSKAQCRARPDCAPVYGQDLDGADRPIGDPYYATCIAEK